MSVPKNFNRVQEGAPAPGLGAVALSGVAAPGGFKTVLGAGFITGDVGYFLLIDGSANWELIVGTYTSAGNSLARTTSLDSSTGSPVNFASGAINVLLCFPASKALVLDTTGVFDNAIFRKFGESTNAVTASTGATNIDVSLGGVQLLTMNSNTALTFINPLATSISCSFMLKVIQDGTGSRTVTWPASVKWAGGVAPVISTGANKVDIFSFNTTDNGTTWHGFIAGIGY